MRFHQLSMGQRFEFEGEVYVRTKPLIAVSEASGHQRFIRRSALVKVLSQDAVAPAQNEGVNDETGVTHKAILEAFDVFYAACLRNLEEIEGDIDNRQVEKVRSNLKEARQRFLGSLSL